MSLRLLTIVSFCLHLSVTGADKELIRRHVIIEKTKETPEHGKLGSKFKRFLMVFSGEGAGRVLKEMEKWYHKAAKGSLLARSLMQAHCVIERK